MEQLRIKTISVENIKAIEQAKLELNGGSFYLFGGNNRGKTTLLSIARYILGKSKPAQLLKEGEKIGTAEITLTTGETIRMTVTEDGQTLTLVTEGGGRTSAAGLIKKLASSGMEFDINKFLQQGPADKRKFLLKLTGKEEELSRLDKAYKVAYDSRTSANRALRDAVAKVEPEDVFQEVTLEEIDIPALTKIISDRAEGLRKVEAEQTQIDNLKIEIDGLEERIKEFTKKLNTAQDTLQELENAPRQYFPSLEEVETAQEKIQSASEKVLLMDRKQRNDEAKSLAEQLKKEWEVADQEVKDVEAKQLALVQSSNLPSGITITQDGVLLDGRDFDDNQVSTSAKLKAAIQISERMIPEGALRFLTIDASLLDRASRAEVIDFCIENDIQIGMEVVDVEGGEVSYQVIEA